MIALFALTAASVVGSLLALSGRRNAQARAPARPAEVVQFPKEEPAPPSPASPSAVGGLASIGKNLAQGNVLAAGLAATAATKDFVQNTLGGGEGKGSTAAILGPLSVLPALLDTGARRAASAVGITNEKTQQKLGILAASSVVGLAPLVGQLQLLDMGLGLVSKRAQEKVHGALRALDPTSSKSPVGKVVRAFGGLFG
jgi:hypothetical protein